MKSLCSFRRITVALLTLGVLGGMVTMALLRASKAAKIPALDPASARAWEKITPRLQQADSDSAQAGERHLQRVLAFFAEKQKHVRPFADDVLGWGGKWAFVQGKLFGDDGKNHQAFLRKTFEQHLFNDKDLKELLQSAIVGYLSELEGQENALLVALRADLSDQDLPALSSLEALGSDEAFRVEYRKMLSEVIPVVSRDLKVTVGREAAVWVGSDIAAAVTVRIASAVAVRLGVSGGILGTGAASGAATLGVGLVVGLIVDAAVDWIMHRLGYDPAGEIARQTSGTLVRIRDLMIEGDPEIQAVYVKLRCLQEEDSISYVRDECRQAADQVSAGGGLGLRHEFNRLRDLRASLREAALKKLILKGSKR